MPIHDEYARLTPWERALPDAGFAERHFEALEAEAGERGVPLADPGVFAMLTAGVAALEELAAPEGDAGGDEALTRLATLLFHAFHHHRAGRPLLLVRAGVVRYLVGTDPGEGEAVESEGGIPGSAYVQLPQHLVWTDAGGGERPRSIDGFFWTLPGDGTLHVLAVAGLIEERPGFTVIPLPGVPLGDAELWAVAAMRPEGDEDFSTEIPGSEMEGLFEVRTSGELLKLGARLDRYLARFPDSATVAPSPCPDPESEGRTAPRPSTMKHRVVTLD